MSYCKCNFEQCFLFFLKTKEFLPLRGYFFGESSNFSAKKDAVADLDQGRTQIKFEGGTESSGGAEKFSELVTSVNNNFRP